MTTTAEVFSDYLGLTPENAPWAYSPRCSGYKCGSRAVTQGELLCYQCADCGCEFETPIFTLTATSPLAPEPTPGWLEVLVRHKEFVRLEAQHYDGPFVAEYVYSPDIYATHPTHAVARALIAADPTLRAACERASDYNKETPNV